MFGDESCTIAAPARPNPAMKIAKPLLLTITPIGVIWGIVEANRFHTWLAVLMIVLVSFIGLCIGLTVRTIRREQQSTSLPRPSVPHDP